MVFFRLFREAKGGKQITSKATIDLWRLFSTIARREKKNSPPITTLGRSKRSLRIEKQNVQGMGSPEGLSSTQWLKTEVVVFSNACDANFSQYSITDWFSKSCVRSASSP